MKRLYLTATLILLPWSGQAATLTHDFEFPAASAGSRQIGVFDPTPGDGTAFSSRSEVSLVPIPFTLPRFDPARGTLTDVEVAYRLGDIGAPGQNSVVGTTDTDCGAPDTCLKVLGIEAAFTYGLAIDGVVGNVASVDGLGFDVALESGKVDGTDSDTGLGQALALSGFESGDSASRTFLDLDPFLGSGDLAFNALNAANVILDIDCTPTLGPVTTCSETATVFMLPSFEVELTYDYTPAAAPNPMPIPVPAGLPLLSGALLSLVAWRRFKRSAVTT